MKLKIALAATALALVSAPAFAAISLGDTLQIQYLFPTIGSVVQTNSTLFTGPGTTLPIIYTGTATFTANMVTLTDNPAFGSYNPASFSGVKITDLTNAGAFSGWAVLPGATHGYDSFALSGGSLYVNWQGQPVGGSMSIGGGVPEPATWALMLGGFGLAGVALRRRRVAIAA